MIIDRAGYLMPFTMHFGVPIICNRHISNDFSRRHIRTVPRKRSADK